MAFISPSGDGLKVVFKARLEWGNLIDNQQEMAKLLGVSEFIDEKCKDGSRGHFLTTEEDLLYIDEEVFTYENKAFGEKYNEQYRERFFMVCPLRRSSRSCWAAWCRDRATDTRRCGIWPIC
jgi:hypothetical protein